MKRQIHLPGDLSKITSCYTRTITHENSRSWLGHEQAERLALINEGCTFGDHIDEVVGVQLEHSAEDGLDIVRYAVDVLNRTYNRT